MLLLPTLFALGAATPLFAQQPTSADRAAPDSPEIIVEGQRIQKQTVDAFVRQLTPARIGGQLGRFEDPVCPVALGMGSNENRLVGDRLRQLAAAVGIRTDREGCVPNLYVLVGRDKKEVIHGLDEQFPALMSGVSRKQMRELAEEAGPTASWQILDRLGADGMPLSMVRMAPDAPPVRLVRSIGSPSRIQQQTKVKFLATIIVVEARALKGVTTRQLADYAAMRTFAATGAADGPMPAQSILSLFDGRAGPDEAPASVTWWDFAFLKSLYASSGALTAAGQRGEMNRIVAKELAKVPPEER